VQHLIRATLTLVATIVVSAAAFGEGDKSNSKKGTPADQATLLGQYADWGAYTATPSSGKVCFALAKPKSSTTNPANRKRDPTYVFISTRPSEKVHNEVSVIIGYQFRPDADATAEIGSTRYSMYTQHDGAWIKNVREESALLEAMRKGSELTIKGTSSRNTQSTDVYSLKGVSQAIDRAGQECR
jgi:invasion protein IalB